jgi:hypothetical protein
LSSPTPKSFDLADLDRALSDQDRLVMAETIFAWADLDTGISRLILLIFGIQDDAGSILIGNMDLKTKVEKIKMLHEHHGHADSAQRFAKLITAMKDYSDCRNIVAHRKCVGRLISEPSRLAFLSAKHVKKTPGQFEIVCVDHSELVASANFARDTAVKVHEMIVAIEDGMQDSADD